MKNFIFCAVDVRIIEMFTGLCFVINWIGLVPNSHVSFIFEEDVGDDLSVCLMFISRLRENQSEENEVCSGMQCVSTLARNQYLCTETLPAITGELAGLQQCFKFVLQI